MDTDYFFAEDAADFATLAPPMDAAAQLDWLRLIRSRRVGPTTFRRLLAEHGSARAALLALNDVAAAAGVTNYQPCPVGVAQAEMRAAHRLGAKLLCMGDANYPASLGAIPDAPPLLWALGDVALLARPLIAMVGARNASSLGTRMARNLAQDLAEAGFAVVSGLARGIDTAAHQGALAAGTIAAMAGGLDVIYPPENAKLAADIAARGLCLSEMPPGERPQARHFPARNRIVAGLAQTVIVVEAAAKSGSLITARMALDYGREVMAVPGHPFDARAAGCNMLIRDGAPLIRGVDDIIAAIGTPAPLPVPKRSHALANIPPTPAPTTCGSPAALNSAILNLLSTTPVDEDSLIRDLSRPAPEVMAAILTLELQGAITRSAGGRVARLA